MSEDAVKSKALLQCNDIVFVRSNGNKDLVGRCMIIPKTDAPLTYSGFCIRCRIKDTTANDPKFYLYLFKSPIFRKLLSNNSVGANIQNLSQARLARMELTVPNFEIQCKISDILSAYDDMIDNCKKQIALFEEAAQRLYREWFVDLRFPGHETTPVGEDGLPQGWSKERLRDVADIIMGQSPTSKFYNYECQGLPFHQGVSTYGLHYVDDVTYTSKWNKEAKANSILFSVRAPVGRINLTDKVIAIGRGLAALNHKYGFQAYLYFSLRNKFFRDDVMGNGTIFSSISKLELEEVEILTPAKDLIQKFNNIVSEYLSEIHTLGIMIKKLETVKISLLPRLISGHIEIE